MPSVIMMIVTSLYSIVDGIFVSNIVGKNAFAAVNLVMPVLMALGSIGFLVGTGGSAIVAKTLGEGKKQKANDFALEHDLDFTDDCQLVEALGHKV